MHYTMVYNDNRNDPVGQASLNSHIYFYSQFPVSAITPFYTLDALIDMVNNDNIIPCGKDILARTIRDDPCPTVDPAQLVKINLLYHSLKDQAVVKPLLIGACGDKFSPLTGDSRMRALTLLPQIHSVPAFVCWPLDQAPQAGGQLFKNFDQFAQCAQASFGSTFWFELSADGKLERYEVNKETRIQCAGYNFAQWCQQVMAAYIVQQPNDFVIDRAWFTQTIDWSSYVLEQS